MSSRPTEADLLRWQSEGRVRAARKGQGRPQASSVVETKPEAAKRRRGVPNKLERQFYDEVLSPRVLTGHYDFCEFEPFTFRMQADAKYTPDYVTRNAATGDLLVWECKGHWYDRDRVRIKWAAQKFPMFDFIAARRVKGEWVYERF